MTTIFQEYMHIFMKYYVDDLLEKTSSRDSHLVVLDKIFKWLQEYKVRLNPKSLFWSAIWKIIRIYYLSQRY